MYLIDENAKIVDTINLVYFDQLVEVIDEIVEKTDEYIDRVNNEYFKLYNNIDAFEFISNYKKYVDEIEQVIKTELLPVHEKKTNRPS